MKLLLALIPLLLVTSCAHMRDQAICEDYLLSRTTAQYAMDAAGFKGSVTQFSVYCNQIINNSML